MNQSLFVFLILTSVTAHAATIRSNGKGGGPWSAPATWQGGKVPSGESVAILGQDVVDLDASAGTAITCEDVVVDPKGALRIIGKNKTALALTIRKSLHVFGGMIVDYSKDPGGRFECVWSNAEPATMQFLLGDGCRLAWKGATGETPNVVFRVATNAIPAGAAPQKPLPLSIGPKMLIECERVKFEGFDIHATGIDGSGTKYNEQCLFRQCHFVRGSVTFQSSRKVDFEGNYLTESASSPLVLHSVSHCRFVSNIVERSGPSAAAVGTYGVGDSEFVGNVFRHSYYGANLVACSDIFLRENRFEHNAYGLFVNSCTRISGERCTFYSNTTYNISGTYASLVEPYRFFDFSFETAPTNVNTGSIQISGLITFDIVNSPLQSHDKAATSGPILFSVYVDVFVTNDQGVPLGRVPLRVLFGDKVVATSRTEAIGPQTGHTPLPSSHRPLAVAWYRFAPATGEANPPASRQYVLEVDGTTLGYKKQTVPLVVDATWVRPDPNKPTKTITVKLTK